MKTKGKILHRSSSTNDVRILFEQDLAFKIIQDIEQLRQNSFWVATSAQVFQEFAVLSLVFVLVLVVVVVVVVGGCRPCRRRYCGVLLLFVVLPLLLRLLVLVIVFVLHFVLVVVFCC